MLSDEDMCLKFFNNDKLDPLTSKPLNKTDYYKYVNMCKKQGIFVNPYKSYRYIKHQPIGNVFKNKDLLYNVMLHMETKDVNILCKVNKNASFVCNDKQFWIDKNNIHIINLAHKINNFIRGDDPNYLSPKKSYIIFDDNITLKHYYGMYYTLKNLTGLIKMNNDIINTIIDLLTSSKKYTVVHYTNQYIEYDFYNVNDLDMFLDNLPHPKIIVYKDDFDDFDEEVSFEYSFSDIDDFDI